MAATIDPTDELLTSTKLAEEWDTSEMALAQRRYRGDGPRFVKIGARVFYRRSDIRAFLDANTMQRTGDTPIPVNA
jgi:hypothetical protein